MMPGLPDHLDGRLRRRAHSARADLLDVVPLDVVPLRAGEQRAPYPTAARHVDP